VRAAALGILGLRVAYGAALLVAPDKVTRSWLGPAADPTRVALRALGAREVFLHACALSALLREQPVAPWLVASIGGDLSDIASTYASRDGLPEGAAPKTAAVAGGSAVLTAAILATS
jgi:hypothetical protein